VFKQAQKSRIAAGKHQYEVAEAEYNEALRQQTALLQQLLVQYRKAEQQLAYYEKQALTQARILREQGNLKLSGGDINHIEWILLINQAIQLEADYLSALSEWNNTVITLNAYSDF
jgi:cobalt-zinc-cadmium resistance protein CzcA